MRLLAALLLLLLLLASAAHAQSALYPPNTALMGPTSGAATFPTPRAIVGADIAGPTSASLGWINIKAPPFNAVGDGVADDTAAIQAAIDTAAQPNSAILCPDGIYKISRTLFLDPPGNLRGADGTKGRTYSSGTSYATGDTVNSAGIPYISLVGSNVGNTPASSPAQWQPFNWNAGTTYAANAIVSFNGVPWLSLAGSNLNNTPSAASTFWRLYYVNPYNIAFSYSFNGRPHIGSAQNNMGCVIKPTFSNGVWIAVGGGQGMSVRNAELVGPSLGLIRGEYSPNGIGIGISKNANRMLIENVMVENVYYASQTSFNGDGQAAENTWRKFSTSNCNTGIYISGTQNFINDVIEPSISCTNNIIAKSGQGVLVQGGNVSLPNAINSTFAVTAVSAATGGSSPNFTYTVTATITTPDSHISNCGTNNIGCIYSAWTLLLPDFGIIPLLPQTYNSATKVATFTVDQAFNTYFHGNGFDLNTATNFGTEIAAVTTMYAAELATTFNGGAFHVVKTHLENPNTCTQYVLNQSFFNTDSGILLESNFANYTISQDNNANLAIKYCQAVFPFIRFGSGAGRLEMRNNHFGNSNSPIIIDSSTGSPDCYIDQLGNGNNTMRVGSNSTPLVPAWSSTQGMCTWGPNDSDPPFQPLGTLWNPNVVNIGLARSPIYYGYVPSPQTLPRLSIEEFAKLSGALPAALGSYPIVNGGTTYSVSDVGVASSSNVGQAVPSRLVKSAHTFFSFGQNLTPTNVSGLSWSAQGQSWVVRADANTLKTVFPGLAVILNSTSNVRYVVTAVYPFISLDGGTTPGFFTIEYADSTPAGHWLTGTQTVTYTGTLISQDPYIWSVTGPSVLLNTSIPFIVASSGTMGNNGAITGLTALPTTYANAYIYLPANAISAGSAAGWYYATCASATACTVFNNLYTSGEPIIPASPTAFATTGPGAFTGVTSSQKAANIIVPANLLGINSCIRVSAKYSVTANANAKTMQVAYGGSAVGADSPAATTVSSAGPIIFCNRGKTNAQVASNTAFGFANTSYFGTAAVNSTLSQTLEVDLQHNTATDNIILDSVQMETVPYN